MILRKEIKEVTQKINYKQQYQQEKEEDIARMTADPEVKRAGEDFMEKISPYRYGYYFSWMGRPIIQLPQDIIVLQEIIMDAKPDLIIETGIAHGGSLIFYASMLELLKGDGRVVGIDIDIRAHNRREIESHPMYHRITMLEGSSVDPVIVRQVQDIAKDHKSILLCLDSCHTQEHVLAELNAYGGLVSTGSYAIVFDTAIEFVTSPPPSGGGSRPWGKGNNPYTAVQVFLSQHPEFEVDRSIEEKIILTSCRGGYLKRIR